MKPNHHPDDEQLVDYAAGSLETEFSLLIATHLTFCPACRYRVALLETVGGALLNDLEPAELAGDSRAVVMAKLQHRQPAEKSDSANLPASIDLRGLGTLCGLLPRPLLAYVSDYAASAKRPLAWRTVMKGLETIDLSSRHGRMRTRLMRIKPGVAMPRHTHKGLEMVCVLEGEYTDNRGHYAQGDISIADRRLDHRPMASMDGDCLCVAVTDAPLMLTGPIGRWFNPFIRS